MTTTLSRILDPSAFYTKRIVHTVGPLDESLHYVMAYEFLIRVLQQGKAQYVPVPLVTFRLWPNSKTVSQKAKFIDEVDVVHKKHGLTRLNAKRIQRLTSREPFVSLRKHFPVPYAFIKKLFYAVMGRLTYRAKTSRQ